MATHAKAPSIHIFGMQTALQSNTQANAKLAKSLGIHTPNPQSSKYIHLPYEVQMAIRMHRLDRQYQRAINRRRKSENFAMKMAFGD